MTDPKIIISLVLFLALGLIGIMARGAVRRMDLSPEQRRRTKNVLRYVLLLVLVAGLAITWASELQSAAIVASGFAVAIVLFNKDIILSVLGWWMKTASGAYRIGDRIRVGDWRGDVIDYGVLSTTLMEVETEAPHGMRTGNIITIPNALLLTDPVVNETRILGFEWRELLFSVGSQEDWQAAEKILRAEAEAIIADYEEELEAQLNQMTDHFGFHPIQIRPAVLLRTEPDRTITLKVRMALPARQIAVLADRMHRTFLSRSTQL
jgi:small-conductance mechanosensitive channel